MKCFGECGSRIFEDQKIFLNLADPTENPLEILLTKEEGKNCNNSKLRRNV